MNINDVIDNKNVKAFLMAIRLGEGTLDTNGYYRIVGGAMFTDTSKHPGIRVWIPKYKVWSTAAGAYQIIKPTWAGLVKKFGFTDFSPATQDKAAIALIIGRNAIDDVIEGKLLVAISKCSPEWASLPGSKAGQRVENLDKIKKVYLDNGGELNINLNGVSDE